MILTSTRPEPIALAENALESVRETVAFLRTEMVTPEQSVMQAVQKTAHVLAASPIQGFWPSTDNSWLNTVRPYNVTAGILTVPVQGVLSADCTITCGKWITGYTYIEQAVLRGRDDPEVHSICLYVDSPGGDVVQLFELLDTIKAVAADKKVFTVSMGVMCSAAYAIGCLGSPVYAPRISQTGSIGVVTSHTDVSGANKMAGRAVTLISSPKGGRKTEYSSVSPLSAQAQESLQTFCDETYELFTSYVTVSRPSLTQAQVEATEGAVFSAKESLALGLIDKVMDFQSAVDDFIAGNSATPDIDTTDDGGDGDMDYNAETQKTAVEQALAAATPNLLAQGGQTERQRIKAILDSEEGKSRPQAAMAYAMTQPGSVDDARTFLAMLPEEAPVAAMPAAVPAAAVAPTEQDHRNSSFDAAMATANPAVGAVVPQTEAVPGARGVAAAQAAGIAKKSESGARGVAAAHSIRG